MKPIAHRETRYGINELGEVINLQTMQRLVATKNPNGYYKVALSNGDGSAEQVLLHRLVAKHFIANPYDHPQVNHIDGNKENNSVNNLEWCSASGNINHALKIGLRPGYMSFVEKDSLVSEVFSGTKISEIAKRIGRGQESLSGMLRRHVFQIGKRPEWDQLMKERRSEATTLRNKTFSRGKGNSSPRP